jgi:perosamine synthetase
MTLQLNETRVPVAAVDEVKTLVQGSDAEFIPIAAPVIGEREIAYVTDAIKSGWVSSIGAYIDKFEEAFADYIGVKHAIAVSNGTVALHLALHTLGIRSGDEVILPNLTFAATAHTVLQAGATPVLVDVEPDTWCIDPRAIERALTPLTRAIMPVHLFGHPADMTAINAIADRHKLVVIEDAAEAHGAEVNGLKVGSLGHVGAFSFYGNKIITTGEGGMLTTSDDDLAARLRFLKDHGMSKNRRYFHTELAFNYRITNLQGALGLAQLEQIETFITKKRQILEWYRAGLKDVPGVTLNVERPCYRNVYWMVSVLLDEMVKLSRDEVCQKLKEQGIDTRPFFVPMNEMPHLSKFRSVGASSEGSPVSAWLAQRGISLPSGCGLTFQSVSRVCDTLARSINRVDLL